MYKHYKSQHGGNIYDASMVYGIKKEEILDYSANINPLGLPERAEEIILSNINNLVNYPDPNCSSLTEGIASYLSVKEENVIAGNGAVEIIDLIFHVLRPGRVLIPGPAFSEYASAACRHGSRAEYFQLKEEDNFQIDKEKLKAALTEYIDAVIICNPNNPASTLTDKKDLLELLEHARAKGSFLIIDEAFIELTIGSNTNSMAEYIKKYSNLFIIRAFTKIFAVPGIRLGYGLGNEELADKMRQARLPWSVNLFAQYMGEEFLKDKSYLEKTALWLKEEIEWFYNELCQYDCLKVFKPAANFILIKILKEDITASILKDKMGYKGVLIRSAENFQFLDSSFFRIAIKDRESNKKFLRILSEVLESCI